MKIRAILLFIFIFLLNSMAFSGAGNDNSQSFIVNKLKPICDLCRANEVRDFASYKEFQQYVETNELYRSF